METVLMHVSKRAYFDLPPEAAQEIIKDSGGNLRKAILVLEALKMQSCVVPLVDSTSSLISITDLISRAR
jgi:DNA polymerase III delta prime subunit